MSHPLYESKSRYRVLSLDGGGSKGIYTVGVLSELELALGRPLYEHFDLIYGTSTGAIIAAMLGMGMLAETIKSKYLDLIPKVMGESNSDARSSALLAEAKTIFGKQNSNHSSSVSELWRQIHTTRPRWSSRARLNKHSAEGRASSQGLDARLSRLSWRQRPLIHYFRSRPSKQNITVKSK